MTAPVRYEFRLAEPVSERAACAFPELDRETDSAGDVFRGPVRDQTQLHGLLARFHTLGLTLVEVRRVSD